MKILTILGTRPEIIRLSRVIPRLDELLGRENHFLVNTGQNSDPKLSLAFFQELGLRGADYNLGATGSLGEQLAVIMREIEGIIQRERPDRFLVLGDTNSSLASIMAARVGISVYHMEAGNRSYSPHSPEEVNRRLIDHVSSVLLPYTERSHQNLLAEGISSARIFVTGNPIYEVIEHYRAEWEQSDVLARLRLEANRFFLMTLHRAENVDDPARLHKFLYAARQLWMQYGFPVIVSVHPRTRYKINGLLNPPIIHPSIILHDPLPLFHFLQLQANAFCVLSDSGTVQEESCLLRRPCVVLRDHTERPETVEVGASVLSGSDPERIVQLVEQVTKTERNWPIPADYLRPNVADIVCRILLSHYERPVL